MSDDREQRIADFFNAIHPHRQIRFQEGDPSLAESGEDGLPPLPARVYVEGMHDDGVDNPRRALAKAIRRSQTADCYYWSGMRGSGKTTELLKLKQELEEDGGFVVFYADMSTILQESEPVEVGDFLLLLLAELASQVEARFNVELVNRGVGKRLVEFLQQEIQLDEVAWEPSFLFGTKFKFKAKQNTDFKRNLQHVTRGRIDGLVEQARDFVREIASFLRHDLASPPRLVYLVDSMERLRGIGAEKSVEVFRSVENLFGYHRDKLRFADLTVVYSVPPYLSAVVSGAENNRVFSLTALKVFERPTAGRHGGDFDAGIDKLVNVVGERYSNWKEFFSPQALRDLARCSGGDYREFFLLIRETLNLVDAEDVAADGVPARFVEHVKKLRRNEFEMNLASEDMDWLVRVVETHDHGMQDREKDRPILAGYIDGKLIYRYRNGSYWWDVHPLLWECVDRELARRQTSG